MKYGNYIGFEGSKSQREGMVLCNQNLHVASFQEMIFCVGKGMCIAEARWKAKRVKGIQRWKVA